MKQSGNTFVNRAMPRENPPNFTDVTVVAQLVQRSPLTPEIHGSNPGIGKLLPNICLLSTVLKRRKIKKKRGQGMAHLIKYFFIKKRTLEDSNRKEKMIKIP